MARFAQISSIALVAGCLVAAGPTGFASAQTLTLKIGNVDAPASHSGVGTEAFAAEVAKLSGGAIKIEVFHAGKLGTIGDQIKNVFSGAQDLHLLYPEFLANLIDETKILSAPYVFRDLAHLQKYHKSELFKPAVDKLQQMGAVLLDPDWKWWIRDPRGVVAVRPIRTPADLAGLKLRIWESKTAIETWRGLGANTIVVPRPEVYLAFKQGIIEGGPETIGIAYDQKSAEVAKFWTRTDEYYQIINIMMNKRKYDGLSAAQRKILHDAASNASSAIASESDQGFKAKREKAMKEFGVQVFEPDLAPWRAKAKGIVEKLEVEGVIPKGLAAKAQAL
jgi:TRAP-type C4-dicarboxylate transport system substrate-binding protein